MARPEPSRKALLAVVRSHSRGTAELTDSGIDVSLIAQALRLSPLERIRRAAKLANFGLELQRKSQP